MVDSEHVLHRKDSGENSLAVHGVLDRCAGRELSLALKGCLRDPGSISIDLGGISGMTGTGLGAIIKCHAIARSSGRQVRLANVARSVSSLLGVTGLSEQLGVTSLLDAGHDLELRDWMPPLTVLSVPPGPPGMRNLNVNGRKPSGPLQGFGSLWQKTYTLRAESDAATPAAANRLLREELPSLQPPGNRFYAVSGRISPGSIVLINARVMGMPLATGVVVMHANDDEFTLLTPQGHPESGWVTFSARPEPGENGQNGTVVEIQSLARASDPVYEFALRFLGAGKVQESIWRHVLAGLAVKLGVSPAVTVEKEVVEPNIQWSAAGGVVRNAGAWTMLNVLIRRA